MPNIALALGAMTRERPHALAVVFPDGRDRQGRVRYTHYTFAQLNEESDRLAAGLRTYGIGPGVRTVLMVTPSLDFFALVFALFKADAVPVLVDPGMGVRNLGVCLAEAAPEAFIGVPKAHIARMILRWARTTIKTKVIVGPWLPGCGVTLDEIRRIGRVRCADQLDTIRAANTPDLVPTTEQTELVRIADGPELVRTADGPELVRTADGPELVRTADPTAAILFTSGSTGVPKGAVYTHEIFNAQVEQLRQLYGIEPGEIDLPTFPLFALFAPALGMTAIIPDMDATRPGRVDPRRIVEAIENFGVTNMFGSPALIDRVGRHLEAEKIKLPTLRRVISAGAPVASKVLARFAAALAPGVQIFTPYGATEALPVCSIGSGEILAETASKTATGAGVCVGSTVPWIDLRIIRISDEPISTWSDDLTLPAGQIGEIVVSGAVVTREYYRRPESTALAKIPDPAGGRFFHRMGDVGYLDDKGRVWFCGRKSHRVRTAEGTLYTIPCEAVFNQHPKVFRTALVGVPRSHHAPRDYAQRSHHAPRDDAPDVESQAVNAEPVLCIELEKSADCCERTVLLSQLRELGAAHPHTRSIRRFLFHPAFPVDIRHNAKIFREKLAAWAAKQRASE